MVNKPKLFRAARKGSIISVSISVSISMISSSIIISSMISSIITNICMYIYIYIHTHTYSCLFMYNVCICIHARAAREGERKTNEYNIYQQTLYRYLKYLLLFENICPELIK